MRKLLFWSGGCDSTYFLYNLSQKYPKQDIHVFSFEHNCMNRNGNLLSSQKVARENLKKEFRKHNIHNHIYYDVFTNVSNSLDENLNHSSNSAWSFFSFVGCVLPYICEKDTIYLSYVKEDVECHRIPYFKEFKNIVNNIFFKDIEIEFPLEYVNKYETVKFIKDKNWLDKVSYCLMPKKNHMPCGVCRSCQMVIMNLELIKIQEKYDNVKEFNYFEY